MLTTREKIGRYIDAGFPIIYLNSAEDEKCDALIKEIAGNTGIIEWNAATGFWDGKDKVREDEWQLIDVLGLVNRDQKAIEDKIIVLKDIHPYLDDPKIVALLKEIAVKSLEGLGCCIVIVSPVCKIPKEIESYVTLLELDPVRPEEIREIILDFISEQDITKPTEQLMNDLVNNFKGLTDFEIRNILALAITDNNGELYSDDLEVVLEQKMQVIKKSGILEMVQVTESIDDIGGLENLKDWLARKAKVFKNINAAQQFGVDAPKGVLIAGMPGCGKSLNAKAAARLFEVPLLRMDMGRLLGKYVGESEANMRKALALADNIAPCVLWIDEMEKAFAGIGGTGGGNEVTTRLFGTFLTWLQEKKSLAFVVATANDISKMPPELLRKGRFDEIFYVDLPNEEERKKIFEIHIAKRRKADLPNIDINELVKETNGYSGADIEGVVKDAVEDAFANGKNKVELADIKQAIKNTHSLSEIMKKSIEDMKKKYTECKFKNASC